MEAYKDASYKKHQIHELIKEKNRADHESFINHGVKNHIRSTSDYHDTLTKHL